MSEEPPDRRSFLGFATCALGAGVGLAVVGPALRLVVAPAGLTTVSTPKDPIDLGFANAVKVGGPWQRLDVVAPVVSDAWTSARDVVLGSAYVRRPTEDKVEAFSAVCPHLGCAVGYDEQANSFLCPCHDSKWNGNGELQAGAKAKRGLDPLPIEIKDGKLRVTWQLYALDTAERKPA